MTKLKDQKKIDFPKLFDQALAYIVNVAKLNTEGDIGVKRKVIGSIFPEKLEFYENHYRTAKGNILLSYIFQINNELGAKKNRKEK